MENHKKNARPDRASLQEADIRAALTRILESAEFARSRRVGSFLRFVVEEGLAGRGDRLKAFSIAREVYGRDEKFDPRTDTVVRVEAGRLRRRLASYYETVGRDDPVRIDMPKGGYTPTFNWNEDVASNVELQAPTPPPASVGPNRNTLILISTLMLAFVVVFAGWIVFVKDRQAESSVSDIMMVDPGDSSTAFLVVLPLVRLANDPMEDRLAAGLVEAIVNDLAKLSGLSVMAHASLMNLDSQSADLSALRRKYGSTHALRGSLEREGDLIRVNVQLIDIATSTTIWADRLDGVVSHVL